jgi:SAM-dependent methyltransferase
MVDRDIAAHYELGLEEGRLLADGRPRLELVRTLELLDRFLPPPPCRVLDVGGGTGVYALPLCERGYSVKVVEPMRAHVERVEELAAAHDLASLTAVVGDARDLGDMGDGYDAVLLLGPLYHLTEAADRARALREAVRAARPGGVVAAVGISRFASLIDGLRRRILNDPVFRSIVEQDLRDGQHRNPDVQGHPEYFTTAYFHRPEELLEEARAAGLLEIRIVAIEGPAWIVEDSDDMENQLFAARVVESEPALLGASAHLMVVGTTAT